MIRTAGNPTGRPNSDVVFPYVNGLDMTRRNRLVWIVDFGTRSHSEAARYEEPFKMVEHLVRPERAKTNQAKARDEWWLHWCARPEMNAALNGRHRFIVTPRVSKHRIFAWLSSPAYVDCQLIAFARSDDYFFGVLHSRFHEIWALKLGTRLETRPRYTPTTCFETFPFPGGMRSVASASNGPDSGVQKAIAAAAKELNELRENWLNPPEWTKQEILEFPGTVGGPWDRYIDPATIRPQPATAHLPPCSIGTVRYPRVVARDADCAARLKERTLTKLYNARPAWLADCHARLDAAVAAAYGWPIDLTDDAILERLLALNMEQARQDEGCGGGNP